MSFQVKSERGSPLHGVTDPNHSGSSSSSSSGGPASAAANLLATQTGATSISITKQPPAQPTTTNVIIKPPVIKDFGSHLSGGVANSSAVISGSGSGNGTTSLVVSVPLSPVSGGSSLNLPGGGASSSSTSQNLFQQAIQNRSEHLNFPNASRTSSQGGQGVALSRSSPNIPGGVGHHLGGDSHGGMLHRQSPLIQASSLSMDNGGRSSLSPSISGGNVMHTSEGSSMLKVTYEKQSPHGNIVSSGGAGRLASLQDEAMSSSRRSR